MYSLLIYSIFGCVIQSFIGKWFHFHNIGHLGNIYKINRGVSWIKHSTYLKHIGKYYYCCKYNCLCRKIIVIYRKNGDLSHVDGRICISYITIFIITALFCAYDYT